MGIDLAKAASVHGRRLKANPYKCLMHMALVALDRPNGKGQPPNLYYAGWESLATALGFDVPDGDHDRRRDLYEIVARAIRQLKKEGLIQALDSKPRKGQRQTFRLTLSPAGSRAKPR
jgi:hypothetical protein